MARQFSLDDLYRMTAHVYSEQNAHRPASATFLHFVEVCGMLTIPARNKRREAVSFEDAICKALGWFFPLMAKCGVVSVEALVYRKFPNVCPYCRKKPHVDLDCKTVRGTETTVNHERLKALHSENLARKPIGLNEWQSMFQEIYPRTPDDGKRSVIGLMEELGELAEALRVFDRHPRFLAGEAADAFSYIMGLANEYHISLISSGAEPFNFESAYLARYPGLCIACGNTVCTCPSVPPATIGRMAKELDVSQEERLFQPYFPDQSGADLCTEVLDQVGGMESVWEQMPLDRGQVSNSLIVLCLRLGDAIASKDAALSARLKNTAVTISKSQSAPGDKRKPEDDFDSITKVLGEAIRLAVAEDPNCSFADDSSLAFSLAKGVGSFKVLMVGACAMNDDRINIEKEIRSIRSAVKESKHRDFIELSHIIGCTIDDLRRKLLETKFDFVHFMGHGFEGGIVLCDSQGDAVEVTADSLRGLIGNHPSILGVLLNCCDSLRGIDTSLGKYTIGMEEEIDDEHAVSFAVGFYDAIGAGFTVERAIVEGRTNVRLQHSGAEIPLKILEAAPATSV